MIYDIRTFRNSNDAAVGTGSLHNVHYTYAVHHITCYVKTFDTAGKVLVSVTGNFIA